jgi:error-prone DNA polymerase
MRLGYSRVGEIAGLSRERFMNPERVGMPDIDIDFEYRHRDRVIDYVYRRYGHDHVARVATYNTFHARSALRSLGKALGFSEEELDPLAKRIPHYACADQIRPLMTVLPELQGSPLGEPRYQLLLDSCEKLAGFPRFLGMHLGGVVISDVPLINLTPLQKSGLGPVICQFDMLNNQPMGFYPPRVIGNEARRRGIVLLPMDINISGIDFTVEIMEEGKEAI